MKVIYSVVLALLISYTGYADCIKGTGKTVEDKIYVPNITSIIVNVPMNLVLTPSENESVSVKTNEDVLKNLIFNYDGGELVIKGREDLCPTDLTVFISLKTIKSIKLNKNVKLTTSGSIKTEDFEIDINGPSEVNIALEADEIEIDVDGPGNVIIMGSADELSIKVDGKGTVDAGKLLANYVNAELDGDGTIIVNPAKSLKADLDGGGKILYKNKPVNLDIQKDGNGTIDQTK